MDVAAWLRGLALEQYAPAFHDNDVDGEVLSELTADDLISIGVTSVGHRRKLLAAIAALKSEAASTLAADASDEPSPTLAAVSAGAGGSSRDQPACTFLSRDRRARPVSVSAEARSGRPWCCLSGV